MLPDRVSNPGPLTYESGALPIALRGPAWNKELTRLVPWQNDILMTSLRHHYDLIVDNRARLFKAWLA